MKKKILNQLFAAALVCGSLLAMGNIPANAEEGIKFGMKTENGNTYFYDENGVKETNKWSFYHTKQLEGWYHSDENGMMQKNATIKDAKGNDCVLGGDGKLTNRTKPEFNESKDTGSEVKEPEIDTYSRKEVDGKLYYVNIKGEKKIGWVLDNATHKWYYTNKDGVMQKDIAIIEGDTKYVLGTDGAWIN